MELAETEIRNRLLDESEEFRDLAARHHEYDERLALLFRREPLSERDRFEQSELKKRKLALKDRMAAMIRDYGQEKKAVATY